MKKILILPFILILSLQFAYTGKVRTRDEIRRMLQEKLEAPQVLSDDLNSNKQNSKTVNENPSEVKDELIVPRYKSALTTEERSEYLKWVEFKNSFNTNEGELVKLKKFFAPENPTYYSTIYKSGWPFYSLAGIFGFFLIVYLILRFGNSTILYTDRIKTQSDEVVKSIEKLPNIQESLKYNLEKVRDADYVTTIYNYQQIKEETVSFANKAKEFSDRARFSEASRHNFEFSYVVVIPLLIIIALISYFKRKSTILLIISLLIFILIIPTLIIEGLNTSQFIISIDMCKDINKHIESESNPIAGKGIGIYVSCPSKPVQVMINTARFELGNSFNILFNNVKKYMSDKFLVDLGEVKRNNKIFSDFAETYKDDEYLLNALNSLISYNEILTGLEGLITCQLAEDMVNYTEEKFCYKNITNEFNNLIFYSFGILGLLILSIGINKMIVLLSPIYLNLGKKHEGEELINETG